MSIRLRLTLLYSAILALTLIVFSTVLYVSQTHLTYDSIKENLVRQADAIANGPRRAPSPFEQPHPDAAPGNRIPSIENWPSGVFPGRWTQIRSLDGAVVGGTFDLSDEPLPLSERGLQSVQSGAGWFETATVQEQPLLIFSRSFTSQAGGVQIVQVAMPIGERAQSLYTLRLILAIGCSVVSLAAFAMGWFLSGLVLKPIQHITNTAQAIGAEHNFSRRVQHTGPQDEVGQLATTFNDMLVELESAYRQIEGALESQRRFVADASHELRTPLTTVRGNIELLTRTPPIDALERTEVLADTRDEVERLIRLVNQLLVLARADAGQQIRREPLALRPLIEDARRQARLLAPQRVVICEPAPDVMVMANRDALKQVLLILLDNALVHTAPDATVEVTVGTEDSQVRIEVRDTGPGIPPEMLSHIFERFYRGQVARNGPGTGLGLAIAKELVEAQEGTITAESQAGLGSSFTVILPQAI